MTESLITPIAKAQFIVTLPPKPSFISEELQKLAGASFTTFTSTSDAFIHLANRAKERLVVMTPFIDGAGAAWATEIFSMSQAANKVLILRDAADLGKCGQDGESLRKAAGNIYEYSLLRTDGGETYAETFHAKIVLADGVAAYVGSANFLYRSREANLECGFILEGEAVTPVAILLDAVLNIFKTQKKL